MYNASTRSILGATPEKRTKFSFRSVYTYIYKLFTSGPDDGCSGPRRIDNDTRGTRTHDVSPLVFIVVGARLRLY